MRAQALASTCRLIATLVAILLASVRPAGAQQSEATGLPNEYTLKAVFLYSFGRYVQWPDAAFSSPSDAFVIGILDADSIAGALNEIAAKKTVQQRPIVVRRFASLDEFGPLCHILFVGRSLAGDQQAALFRRTEGKPVLVVGETPGFAERGGGLNFFIDGDRVRFEINIDTARRAQLRMDAKLLGLGKPVGNPRTAGSN